MQAKKVLRKILDLLLYLLNKQNINSQLFYNYSSDCTLWFVPYKNNKGYLTVAHIVYGIV